jgi:hypothetical protein
MYKPQVTGAKASYMRTIKLRSVFFTFFFSFTPTAAWAASDIIESIDVPKSSWQAIKEKLRVRNFSEIMSPAFKGNPSSVPYPDGRQFTPGILYNIFWADYEFAPNYKVVYWQRAIITLNSNQNFQNAIFPRDPRFALRRTKVFDIPRLDTTFDVYIQPRVMQNMFTTKNHFEVGFRTNSSYAFPRSKWNIGLISEFTTGYLDPTGKGARAFGWAMPWASYDWTSKFSTQHYVTLPVANSRDSCWRHFAWDDPSLPYIQNGISYSLSSTLTTSVFLNNYLMTKPSLKNTWASVWLSLAFL